MRLNDLNKALVAIGRVTAKTAVVPLASPIAKWQIFELR